MRACIIVALLLSLSVFPHALRTQETADFRDQLLIAKTTAMKMRTPDDQKARTALANMPKDIDYIRITVAERKPPAEYLEGIKLNNKALAIWVGKDLNETGLDVVLGVAGDFSAKANVIRVTATTKRNPFAKIKVTVNTRDGKNHQGGFRVVCAPAADPNNPAKHTPFGMLSTPAFEDLTPGAYSFWSEDPNNAKKKSAVLRRVHVTDSGKGECRPIDIPIPK